MAVTDSAIVAAMRSRLRWWTPGEIAALIGDDRWQVRDRLRVLGAAGRITVWDVHPHQTLYGINGRITR